MEEGAVEEAGVLLVGAGEVVQVVAGRWLSAQAWTLLVEKGISRLARIKRGERGRKRQSTVWCKHSWVILKTRARHSEMRCKLSSTPRRND